MICPPLISLSTKGGWWDITNNPSLVISVHFSYIPNSLYDTIKWIIIIILCYWCALHWVSTVSPPTTCGSSLYWLSAPWRAVHRASRQDSLSFMSLNNILEPTAAAAQNILFILGPTGMDLNHHSHLNNWSYLAFI